MDDMDTLRGEQIAARTRQKVIAARQSGDRQPPGQWCFCPEPPEGQDPHDCYEDHARRPSCGADGAHVHPRPCGLSRLL